ncbi:hypothetical protein Musp01_09480 [Muricauda sp. NBRC 101325]|nr:hypothetical protein Musp01_09480 [Muricauda sp. NBRC 101325]
MVDRVFEKHTVFLNEIVCFPVILGLSTKLLKKYTPSLVQNLTFRSYKNREIDYIFKVKKISYD